MNIKITSLKLENFKCFREKEFHFNADITTILGRNGVGKTTIADAILWCLFGKNSDNQSDFNLKTLDADGGIIPHLDHSVEMILTITAKFEVGGPVSRDITLKRTLKETWVKKRASEEQVFKNNTTEYLVNGEVITASDYKKYIAQMIDEDVFRAITNPSYFPSLHWKQQREFLSNLAGDISPEEIAADDSELQLFSEELKQDILAYIKHLAYQKKIVREKLELIPVRLEEQNKALPPMLDWEMLKASSDHLSSKISEISQKIIETKNGNGGDVKRESIRKQLNEARTELDRIEQNIRIHVRTQQQLHDKAVNDARLAFGQTTKNIADLQLKIGSYDTLITRCKMTLDDCEKQASSIRERWAANQTPFSLKTEDGFCPTCGQPLPDDMREEKFSKLRQEANARKEVVKQQLIAEADKVKALIAETKQQIADYETQRTEDEQRLNQLRQLLNDQHIVLANAEKAPVPTAEEMQSSSDIHKTAVALIRELENALVDESTDDAGQLHELEEQKNELTRQFGEVQSQLATKATFERISNLIADIEKEQKELINQLSAFEREEDIARRYQSRQNEVLEERINQHFQLVKWKLFRTVNNGGDPFDEPYCECYVNGHAYHDGLNQAARLNAGLDICETLGKHYDVFAPIIIDNAESNLNILATTGQQIRLQVADTELKIS